MIFGAVTGDKSVMPRHFVKPANIDSNSGMFNTEPSQGMIWVDTVGACEAVMECLICSFDAYRGDG